MNYNFEYIIPANETLYKGMNTTIFDMTYKKPIWFTKNERTANKYGKYTHSFLTKKPLKLINIIESNAP